MNTLETERLHIRNFREEDWADLLEIAQKYEASEYAKYDSQWPQTEEGIKKMVDWISKGDDFLAVELIEESKVIGLLSIAKNESVTDQTVHHFGYVFNSEYQGKGFATESCKKVIEYLFEELNVDKLATGTAALNRRSCKLLKRLGFKVIGQKRFHFRKDATGNPIEFQAIEFELLTKDVQGNEDKQRES